MAVSKKLAKRIKNKSVDQPALASHRIPVAAKTLDYKRNLLEQIKLCSELIEVTSKRNALRGTTIDQALKEWIEVLGDSLRSPNFADIPDDPVAQRATEFFQIVSSVVSVTDSVDQDNIKRFLMHVAWHEGARLTTRIQAKGGPARSFFQFEAYRAKEALGLALAKSWSKSMITASGNSAVDLKTARDKLPDYDKNDPSTSFFPKGNLIEALMETNDPFATYLARAAFSAFPDKIGPTNSDHADYWYKHWKVTGGDETQLKKTFVAEAAEVDALIVPNIKQFSFFINGIDNYLERSGNNWLQKTRTRVTNTYADQGHDQTWIYMQGGRGNVFKLRIPVAGGTGQESDYGRPWYTYATGMVANYT